MEQEESAALRLVGLSDLGCPALEAEQAPEKPVIGWGVPPNVPRPPPAIRPEGVEAAVVANSEGGVCLDRIAAEPAELGPTIECARMFGDEGRHGRPPRLRVGSECLREKMTLGSTERRNDGRRQTSGQADRLGRGVAHQPILADCARASPR